MPRIKDITGQRFGKLTVIEYAYYHKERQFSYWKCICDCGNEKITSGFELRRGHVQSCGCYNAESHTTHGLKYSRLYKIYHGMLYRCKNKKESHYYGKGITVCDEWKQDFMNFYNWAMANGYRDDLSIDRIDNDGNYEPSNCRWATKKQQGRNQSTNVYVSYEGKEITFAELSEKTGLSKQTLFSRYKRGDRNEKLIRPVAKQFDPTKYSSKQSS